MALDPIAPGAPSQTYARINAAIQTINALVQQLADLGTAAAATDAALHDETGAIRDDLTAETARLDALLRDVRSFQEAAAATDQALHDEGAATREVLAGLPDQLILDLLNMRHGAGRPGDCPFAFTGSSLGSAAAGKSLDPTGCITLPLGRAYRIAGVAVIAPRVPILFDPDAILILRVRYWRLEDVSDPNNSAVDLGIQWLGPNDANAGITLLHRERDLRVQDGAKSFEFRMPSETGVDPLIALPKGAVSWRPYLRTYGDGGATALALMDVKDATFAGVYAPDVSALAAALRTIQGQIANGLPFATPILPSYAVQDLPKPGSRGRKAFALDGRAPSAAGALEAANAGTGVEVTDNGVAWVITGTNQKVQA